MRNNEMNDVHDMDRDLRLFYQQVEPSPEFINALEAQLNKAQSIHQFSRRKSRAPRLRWAVAPTVALLLVVIVLFAIGPQQVLAQVRALLGYVPGFGFVDTSDFRVLSSPVSQTQDGVTLSVKQVVSNQDETYILMSMDGLTGTSKQEFYDNLHQFILEHPEEWLELEPELWRPQVSLTLPDKGVIDEYHYSGAPWEGYFVFPAIPQEVLEMDFNLERIPGMLPGIWPENWHIDLQLEYIADPQPAPVIEDFNYESPQIVTPIPVDAPSEPDMLFGLNLELIDVVYTEFETVLRLRIQGIPPEALPFGISGGRLEDDLSNTYISISRDVMGFQQDESVYVMTFEPLQPGASRLSLSGVIIEAFLPIERQSIFVDFGGSPQVGDRFPIDQNVLVLGVPIHFSGVQISLRGGNPAINEFRFDVDPFPVQDGWLVSMLGFTADTFERLGSPAGGGGGGGGGTEGGQRQMNLSIGIPTTVPLPTGLFEFPLDNASIMLECSSITWEVQNGQ